MLAYPDCTGKKAIKRL